MTDNIKVLNEFLPKAQAERLGAIKIGDTLNLDVNEVLNVDDSAMASAYMTNCAIEVPQNINIELLNGVLTLKAGSKVYIPDGFESDGTTKKFREVTIQNDLLSTTDTGTYERTFVITSAGNLFLCLTDKQYSGDTQPSDLTNNQIWYDTANNLIKYSAGDNPGYSDAQTCSFPIVQVSSTNNAWTSINTIFNGFGYIGLIAFVLPGVTALASNGKTADGNLINDKVIIDRVLVSINNTRTGDQILAITPGATTQGRCFMVPASTYTTSLYPPNTARWYNPNQNKYYLNNAGTWQNDPQAHLGVFTKSTVDKVDSFTPVMVFRSADYNEIHKELNDLHTYKMNRAEIQYVSAVPGNPQDGVIYLIAQ